MQNFYIACGFWTSWHWRCFIPKPYLSFLLGMRNNKPILILDLWILKFKIFFCIFNKSIVQYRYSIPARKTLRLSPLCFDINRTCFKNRWPNTTTLIDGASVSLQWELPLQDTSTGVPLLNGCFLTQHALRYQVENGQLHLKFETHGNENHVKKSQNFRKFQKI